MTSVVTAEILQLSSMHVMFSIAAQFPLKLTFLFSNYFLKRQQANRYVEWSDFFGRFFTVYHRCLALLSTC